MATTDTCCTLSPYFSVHPGKLDAFRALCERFVSATRSEKDCLYYGFAIDDHTAVCREGYAHADGLLAHLTNVQPLIGEALKLADLSRLEVHGPAAELAKLRGPMADLKPRFFTLEYGFRS